MVQPWHDYHGLPSPAAEPAAHYAWAKKTLVWPLQCL